MVPPHGPTGRGAGNYTKHRELIDDVRFVEVIRNVGVFPYVSQSSNAISGTSRA